jgi:hypothetical protein
MSKLSLKNEQFQTGNSRYASRHALRLDAVLADTGAQITILNLSPTGLLIETEQALGKGDTVLIDMPVILDVSLSSTSHRQPSAPAY